MAKFYKVMTKVDKEILSRDDTSNLSWFEYNKEDLLLLIIERNKILLAARSSNNIVLKQKCINTRNNVKDMVRVAKSA